MSIYAGIIVFIAGQTTFLFFFWDSEKNLSGMTVSCKSEQIVFSRKENLAAESDSFSDLLQSLFSKLNAAKCDKIIFCGYLKSGNTIKADLPRNGNNDALHLIKYKTTVRLTSKRLKKQVEILLPFTAVLRLKTAKYCRFGRF